MASQNLEFTTVKTTLPKIPYPSHVTRKPIHTDRLLIRPLEESDLPALHALRSEDALMRHSAQGGPDPDMEHTRMVFQKTAPPSGDADTYSFGIFLHGSLREGEGQKLIGIGGSHLRADRLGWPAIGYMLSEEFWGQGFATEFVKAFMGMWWGLERAETEVKVEKGTVVPVKRGDEVKDGVEAREMIVGITGVGNGKSQKVLEKGGFVGMKEWAEGGTGREDTKLLGFGCLRPRSDA